MRTLKAVAKGPHRGPCLSLWRLYLYWSICCLAGLCKDRCTCWETRLHPLSLTVLKTSEMAGKVRERRWTGAPEPSPSLFLPACLLSGDSSVLIWTRRQQNSRRQTKWVFNICSFFSLSNALRVLKWDFHRGSIMLLPPVRVLGPFSVITSSR